VKHIIVICIAFISLLNASSLSEAQKLKLNSNIIKETKDGYKIEEYNRLNFDKKILFDGVSTDKVVVSTVSTMTHNIINKEWFIAMSSTLSDQMIQSIFMNPQYFDNLSSTELLSIKPQEQITLQILLEFKVDGVMVVTKGAKGKQENFLLYNDIFYQRLK